MKTKEELWKEAAEKRLEEMRTRTERILEYYKTMKPFTCVEDIPDVPRLKDQKLYEEIIVPNLIRCGAIPIDKLEKGKTYIGACRNASEAEWTGDRFIYLRYKFGYTFDESINHFQNDDGYDVFVPIKEKE